MPETGKVLDLLDIIVPDQLGTFIANRYWEWEISRQPKKQQWRELREYIYATDTTMTSNQSLPWKNTTTTPKLTQIRDNLYANYMASMFPNPRWLEWQGASQDDQSKAKTDAIKAYMSYVIDAPGFKDAIGKLVLDYIDYGNCFAMPDWKDDRVDAPDKVQGGYVGPVVRRISPLDLVMNPIAERFENTPKIVRSMVGLGEVKDMLERFSKNDGEEKAYKELWNYLKEVRHRAGLHAGDLAIPDAYFQMDGFDSFQHYLGSDYCEVLTFYGDAYDRGNDTFYKNHIIQVVDRHKVIRKEPNPAFFGYPPIFHAGWRPRQDNFWAMGPLDNLVGMQYRLDHIENLKADLFDLTAFPPIKITGYVEDFIWAPMEKIIVSEEGDVELLKVDVNPLQANFELDMLENKMEALAGAPKEAMGFRTPGEKTAYEVQRLENAAARIFQSKIAQFEELILEPLLNAMLELARRKMDQTTVRVINDEFKIATFLDIMPEDITGAGRIRPMAARHFVEVADRIQSLSSFYQSGAGQDQMVLMHISSVQLAKMFEELLDLEQFKLVTPYVRLSEQAEAQGMAQQSEEDNMMALQTAGGIAPDDFDIDAAAAGAVQ